MGDFSDRLGQPKRYRDCMSEIIGVLKKYDMAGAVTVVSKATVRNIVGRA